MAARVEPPSADRHLEDLTREALARFRRSPEAQAKYPALARLVARALPPDGSMPDVPLRADPNDFPDVRVRTLVGDHLRVPSERLTPWFVLEPEPAVGTSRVMQLTLALEAELGITVPDSALARVRTYGDLESVARSQLRRKRAEVDEAMSEPASFSARITRPGTPTGGDICHAGWFTAYAAETVVGDALRAGRGAKLELIVASTASDNALARVREQLGWLRDRGVSVDVHRGRDVPEEDRPIRPNGRLADLRRR
jgi:hypothetical protein